MKSFVRKIKIGVKNSEGFTMIEMLVVMSIIVIMSVALFANYREIGDQGRVSAFTGKVREDLYLSQTYSLSGKMNRTDVPNGWGVYFNRNTSKYVIFSDLNKSKTYDYPTKLLIHGNETVSAGKFTDSSHAANLIVVTGATQSNLPGMPLSSNGYWQFDGDQDSLSVPDSSNFNFAAEDFAIDMWIYSDTTGSKKYILSKGVGLDKSYELYKDTDDKIKFVIYGAAPLPSTLVASTTLSSKNAISASSNIHIAVTKIGSIVTLFVDGHSQSTGSMTLAMLSLSSSVIVGADNDGRTSSWQGKIDEIRISKGTGRWQELFTPPSAIYRQDDEFLREIKLPPGLVFDSLSLADTATSELNIFFDPSTHLMYGDNNSGNQEAKVVINNAGVAGTGQAGDTPQTLTIDKSGTINWTH